MQQSHDGLSQDFHEWDRLAIVVDKTTKPYQAQFYQFVPGELKLASRTELVDFRARCYACHANGPRAIRPNPDSTTDSVGLIQKAQIALMNLRIKTYGTMDGKASEEYSTSVKFASQHSINKEPLGLPSCMGCHSSTGIRSELKEEHIQTAQFLVEKGLMPPRFHSVSEEEKALLLKN
jgi:hypothetical protein